MADGLGLLSLGPCIAREWICILITMQDFQLYLLLLPVVKSSTIRPRTAVLAYRSMISCGEIFGLSPVSSMNASSTLSA